MNKHCAKPKASLMPEFRALARSHPNFSDAGIDAESLRGSDGAFIMTYGVWTGVALWLGWSAAVVAWRPRVTRSVRTIAAIRSKPVTAAVSPMHDFIPKLSPKRRRLMPRRPHPNLEFLLRHQWDWRGLELDGSDDSMGLEGGDPGIAMPPWIGSRPGTAVPGNRHEASQIAFNPVREQTRPSTRAPCWRRPGLPRSVARPTVARAPGNAPRSARTPCRPSRWCWSAG